MSASWSILQGGTYKTFAALNLNNLSRTLVSQNVDEVSFTADGTAFDGASLWSHGETVIIMRDSQRWFYGRVVSIPRIGLASAESIQYRLAGPWWYLDKCVYQQSWQVYSGGLTAANKSRVILNQNADGDRITSGAQIQAAINHAISRGAPITLGTIDPAISLPFDEQTDITCAEVILKMLRWSPDCICWFDYATAYPTLHCRSRANLSSLTYDVAAGTIASEIFVTPRYDLQIPGVVVNFEQTNEVDGVSYETITTDSAGNTSAINTLFSTIELAGSRVTYLTQKIVTEDWPDPLTTKSWWKAKIPALAQIPDDDVTIHDASRTGVLSRILTEGTIQDWMTGKTAEDDVITAKVDYTVKDADTNDVEVVKNKDISVRVTSTNAATTTYRRTGTYESGEPIPSGLAAALYAAWSQLQYEGQITLLEEDPAGVANPGRKLNFSNGLSAWASMNAMIQQVTESVDDGRTTITFGPATHLGPDDLVALLRASRTRRPAWKYVSRTTGLSTDSGSTDLSGPGPKLEPSSNAGETTKMVMRDSSGDYTKTITLDPSQVTKEDADMDLKPREAYVVDTSDTLAYKRFILASDKYGDGIPVGGGGAEDPGTTIETVGAATEGSETAETTSFTVGTNSKGLALWICSRVVYNESGDKKLYGYARKLTVDKNGKIYSIGAETRYEIDAAVAES